MVLPVSQENIALLIDAENVPSTKTEGIIAEIESHGVVTIRRAYGNWKEQALAGWEKKLHQYAIQPVQLFSLIKGKNAADMALLIDAMDILYTKNAGTFCLVSCDCDFTPLVARLRAEGRQVIGFGKKSAAAPFRASCNHFLFLDEEETPKAVVDPGKASSPPSLPVDDKLKATLRKAVTANATENGWAVLGGVGSYISNQEAFDCRKYGYSQLSKLFEAIDIFEVKKASEAGSPACSVRVRT